MMQPRIPDPRIDLFLLCSDEIRQLLPEYSSYVEETPVLVDHLTQKESGYIAETFMLAALNAGGNVILDSSLKDVEWYRKNLREFRRDFPGLKVAMIHVTAELDTVFSRVELRAKETGRSIPKELTLRSYSLVQKSVDAITPEVDYCCTIFNGEEGLGMDAEGGWERFYHTFEQTDSLAQKIPTQICLATEDELLTTEDTRNCACPSREKGRRHRFSVTKSSEENHCSDNRKFYGQFAHIRKTLDYSYHSNYTFERQVFQDAIINELLHEAVITDQHGDECSTPTEPWIVFTAGAMGAGKVRSFIVAGR
jgi:hypothetical protein